MGYFFKIYLCDHFVFLDHVQFSKRSPTRRCQILGWKNTVQKEFLTVPLRGHSDHTSISNLYIDQTQDWVKVHLNKIKLAYNNAEYYGECYEFISELIQEGESFDLLSDFNIFCIQKLCERMDIPIVFSKSSKTISDIELVNLNISLSRTFKGKSYLSGIGAKKYQDDSLFQSQNLKLYYVNAFSSLEQNPYPQKLKSFTNGLSIIDGLMHLGFDGTRYLISSLSIKSIERTN